ncbi:hypothetical protein QTH91_07695 [Variovorax dokdonensis]|uniref:Uncharacterized protein n=1 Tax=Variovorax dokdonensis TaxID=344883 RepID=A0ABT7N8T4_9BURK|nr:hypothetical protein [Variovorax dokdonensis]MDM0044357.1 hypothetical protein [Variovorax dokdonensis]
MSLTLQLTTISNAHRGALRSLTTAFGLGLGALAPAFGGDDSLRLATMSETELQSGMQSGVQAVLQHVPMKMEDHSVLVGAEYSSATRTATYHYVQATRLDPEVLRLRLMAKNCSTPNTRAMMKRGIRFQHLYSVGDDEYSVTVSDEHCPPTAMPRS